MSALGAVASKQYSQTVSTFSRLLGTQHDPLPSPGEDDQEGQEGGRLPETLPELRQLRLLQMEGRIKASFNSIYQFFPPRPTGRSTEGCVSFCRSSTGQEGAGSQDLSSVRSRQMCFKLATNYITFSFFFHITYLESL